MEDGNGNMIKLTSNNYAIWKPRMEDILHCKDLYDPVEGDSAKPADVDMKKWEKLHRKTVGVIRSWIDQSVFHHVAKETDANSLWKKLESMYERKTAQNKASLVQRLVNQKLKAGQSVADHLSIFQNLINQLGVMEMSLDDEMQALLVLSSLPDSWETLVVSLSNSAPNGNLTMTIVKDALFNEESRQKDVGTDQAHALVVENRGRNVGRDQRNGSRNRSRSRGADHSGKAIKEALVVARGVC